MRKFIPALTALSLIASTAASAQIAPGSSGTSSMHYYGGQEAWDTLSEFGVCFAARQRTDAFVLVSTRPGSVEEAQAYKKMFRRDGQSCLGLTSKLTVDHQMVRGAIAEGLYRRAVPVPPQLAVTKAPTAAEVRNFADAALCFAASHRDEVRAVLARTKLGTDAEHQSVSALLQEFGPCIPQNAKRSISIDTPMARVRLAEALWRLGVPPLAKGSGK